VKIFKGYILFILLVFLALFVFLCYAEDKSRDDFGNYKYLKRKIMENPDDLSLQVDAGEECVYSKRYDLAIMYFSNVAKKNPSFPLFVRVHNNLGHTLLALDDVVGACEEIRIVELVYPESEFLGDLKGRYWYVHRKYKRSLCEFMEEFAHPTCTDSFVGVGNVFWAMQNKYMAKNIYTAGVLFDNDSPDCYLHIADLLLTERNFDKARAIFELVLKEYKAETEAFGNALVGLGDISFLNKDYDTALSYYQRAYKTDVRVSADAYLGMGRVYMNIARKTSDTQYYKKAIECFKKAIKYEYKRRDIHLLLKEAYLSVGDKQRASKEQKICQKLPPYDINRKLKFIFP